MAYRFLFVFLFTTACSSQSVGRAQIDSDTIADTATASPEIGMTDVGVTDVGVTDVGVTDDSVIDQDTGIDTGITVADTGANAVDTGPPVCYPTTNLGSLSLNCDYEPTADAWCRQVCAPANKYAYKCEQGAPFRFNCDRMGPYWCCDQKQCVRENDFDRHCPQSMHAAYNCTNLPFKTGCVKSVNAAYPNLACCAQ